MHPAPYRTTHSYAQTNLQLREQLEREGYAPSEVRDVRRAYRVATQLFSARYDVGRRPFLDHLVGVASILASMRSPAAVVAAGLLHAAYHHGDVGTGAPPPVSIVRSMLHHEVGVTVEAYVAEYDALPWNAPAMHALREGLATLTPRAREIVVMRLANTLELHLDLGLLYRPDAEEHRRATVRNGSLVLALAAGVAASGLMQALARAFQATVEGTVLPALRRRLASSDVEVVPPRAFRRSAAASGRRLALGLRRRWGG